MTVKTLAANVTQWWLERKLRCNCFSPSTVYTSLVHHLQSSPQDVFNIKALGVNTFKVHTPTP